MKFKAAQVLKRLHIPELVSYEQQDCYTGLLKSRWYHDITT
jgi:hypothetical protein